MRWAGAFVALFLAGAAGADVVVLKDGSRVSGRVTDKTSHYEVNGEAGLRTFLKEEVEKVLTGPAELLGDSDAVIAAAKADYEALLALPEAQQSAAAKAAVEKLSRARVAISGARDAFPEDKYSDLDQKLMQCMQLLRLLRDRVGSSYARSSSSQMVNGPPPMSLAQATAILAQPAKRLEAASRAEVREAFRRFREDHPNAQEVATAAIAYLSKSDAEWKVEGASQKALEDYFAKPWLSQLATLTPAVHLEAARHLAAQTTALGRSAPEPLVLFGLAHLGQAGPGAESEKLARGYNLVPLNGAWGSAEGHAVRDMDQWIAAGDFDLAVLSFVKNHRATDTAMVRYVWAYALLRVVSEKKRGWERPVAALSAIKAPSKAVEEHVAALSKSIKTAASCNVCVGEGKLRCTNCFGKKEIRKNCETCKGAGKTMPPGSERSLYAVEPVRCYPCRGRGFSLLIKCEKCKDGFMDCKQCAAPKAAPELADIVQSSACAVCEGRGHFFKSLSWPCGSCLGLGQKLAPKADPSKVLQ